MSSQYLHRPVACSGTPDGQEAGWCGQSIGNRDQCGPGAGGCARTGFVGAERGTGDTLPLWRLRTLKDELSTKEWIMFHHAGYFTTGVAYSANLAGVITVGMASSADLAGDVAIGVASSADLARVVTVGVPSSADFAGVLTDGVAPSADLVGDVTVGMASSADLAGDVAIGVASLANFARVITVGVASSADLAGVITVGVTPSADLARDVTVGLASSAYLTGDVTIGEASSADLVGDVIVGVACSANLAGDFTVGMAPPADPDGDFATSTLFLKECERCDVLPCGVGLSPTDPDELFVELEAIVVGAVGTGAPWFLTGWVEGRGDVCGRPSVLAPVLAMPAIGVGRLIPADGLW